MNQWWWSHGKIPSWFIYIIVVLCINLNSSEIWSTSDVKARIAAGWLKEMQKPCSESNQKMENHENCLWKRHVGKRGLDSPGSLTVTRKALIQGYGFMGRECCMVRDSVKAVLVQSPSRYRATGIPFMIFLKWPIAPSYPM